MNSISNSSRYSAMDQLQAYIAPLRGPGLYGLSRKEVKLSQTAMGAEANTWVACSARSMPMQGGTR